MHDRIQLALDGELPVDQLTPDERSELQRCRAMIGTTLQPLRGLSSIDVSPEVMERVSPEPGPLRGALSTVVAWLWAPRAFSLSIRPGLAMAGAFGIAALIWSGRPLSSSPTVPETGRVIVQFRLGDAAAREVALVGDFNGWRPEHRLHRSSAGVWSVDVALEPGVYDYGFVIDGKTWRLDPLAPQVSDGFGGASSRLAVLAAEVQT